MAFSLARVIAPSVRSVPVLMDSAYSDHKSQNGKCRAVIALAGKNGFMEASLAVGDSPYSSESMVAH